MDVVKKISMSVDDQYISVAGLIGMNKILYFDKDGCPTEDVGVKDGYDDSSKNFISKADVSHQFCVTA